jgi:hypothetical protein
MAQVSYHTFAWAGYGFYPGEEHSWWFGPVSYNHVVHVMAIQLRGAEWTSEIMVKDVRVHYAVGASDWTLLFTVRNTGHNPIGSYKVNFSVVSS